MNILIAFVAAMGLAAAQAGTPAHAVTLSAQWQDDSGELAAGNTVSLLFQRSTTSGGPYTTVGTVAVTQAPRLTYTYVDQSGPSNYLAEGATYYYVVLAQDSQNNQSTIVPQIAVVIPTSVAGYHKTVSVK